MRPVVLVHGLFATPGLMRPLRRQLRAYGHDVHLASELTPYVMGDVRKHADQLDATIRRVRRQTGVHDVRVVGSSQGGLVALWWAHSRDWDGVDRLVTLGTPFRGAPLARFVRPLGWVSQGVQQILPGGPFLDALPAIPLRRPVVAISMQRDPVCPPRVCFLPGMEHVALAGGLGPIAHQSMMFQPRVVAAVHRGLVGC